MNVYENFQEGAAAVFSECRTWESEHPYEHNLILIAGPAGSGKSTFAKMIAHNDTFILSLDRYYLGEARQREEQGVVNFSIPAALDWKRLDEDLKKILASKFNESIKVPSYSMTESRRVGEEAVSLSKRIIVEGVYALRLEREIPFRIYIETPDELLLGRRIERDIEQRGIAKETIISRFNRDVLPALNEFVKPQRQIATVIIENNEELTNR